MKRIIYMAFMFYFSSPHAENYGVFGKTFEIIEMDFLEYIQQKMHVLEENGELKRVQSQFKQHVKEHILRPHPNVLPRAQEDRVWLFNPELIVPYDVKDVEGRVIVKEGTVINPLEKVNLSSTLIFFDGDDKAQVAWVKNALTVHEKAKLILTSGSVKDAANHFKQAIFFDLNGFLVSKFQIKSLPAKVQQKNMRLEITEVAV